MTQCETSAHLLKHAKVLAQKEIIATKTINYFELLGQSRTVEDRVVDEQQNIHVGVKPVN